MQGRPLHIAVALAAALTASVLGAPAPAQASRCLLIFECPAPPSPPPAPTPPPAPVPPPGSPPAGNPSCRPPSHPLRGSFAGVGDMTQTGGERDRRCSLAQMVASGVRRARMLLYWPFVEAAGGRFDFSFYDHVLGQLARYRLKVLPVLSGTPAFLSSAPSWRHPDWAQPRRLEPFARFVRAVARRYGPSGGFWARHPELPRLPIRSWQIWNEPNVSFFWSPRPNARAYAKMLAAASRALKRVDPHAEVVTGGLAESRYGTPMARYLNALYGSGGRRWFDTVALNAYSRTPTGTVRAVRRARALMNRRRDRRARVWVTEFGWASAGPPHRFRAGERAQASRTATALRMLWRHRRELRLRGAIYVMWRDLPSYRSDFWGLHLGLYREDGTPKAAAGSFARTARDLRRRSRQR